MRHSTRPVLAREQSKTRQDRLRYGLLAVLLGATFVMGGSARSDVVSLLLLRPLTAAIFVAAIMTALPLAWRRAPSAVAVAAAALLLCLFHLVPLPSGIWADLPGRQIAMDVYRAAGMSPSWHPLTLSPQHTWNAVFFLLAPLSALLLALSLTPPQVRRLLAILIGLVLLNAGIGVLQSLGTPSLHFYDITNRDVAVGLFANRNHAALSFACALPLLGIYIDARRRNEARWRLSAPLAVTAALLLVPMILLTGSRAGLVWAALALPMMLWVRGRSARPDRRAAAWPWIGIMVLGVAAIFVFKERAPALLRLAETGSASELRLNAVPAIWQAVGDFWPWGSGIGSFVEVYGIYEPPHLLGTAYLNHAHNDVLELLLTGGLPAALLAAAGAASLVRAATTVNVEPTNADDMADDSSWARAGLSIVILLSLASTVDYPLRTPILAVLLAVAAALVARRNPLPLNHGAVDHDPSETPFRRRRRAHPGGTDRPVVRDAA
jgi:O-antigen ligase